MEANDKIWELIAKHASGSIKSAEKVVLKDWIEENKANEEEFNNGLKTWNVMNNKSDDVKTSEAWVNVKTRILSDTNKNRTLNIHRIYKYAGVAAVLLLSVFVYSLLQSQTNKLNTITSNNHVKELTLNDGTVVYINKNSQLSYPNKFNGDQRLVKLQGEAFFVVERNENIPFKVITNNAEITVLGTEFNVNDKVRNLTQVVVKSGSVSIANKNKPTENKVLKSGDLGIISESQTISTINDNPNYLSWKNMEFVFENTPLQVVVDEVSKVYGVKIELDNINKENLYLNSSYKGESVENIVKTICVAFNLKYIRNDSVFVISK